MNYADQCCLELTHWSYMYSVVGNVLGTPQGSSWNTTGEYSQVFEASGNSFQSPADHTASGLPTWGIAIRPGTGSNPSSSTYYDTNVKATLIRHGNYDYVNKAVIWDSNVSSQVLPDVALSDHGPVLVRLAGVPRHRARRGRLYAGHSGERPVGGLPRLGESRRPLLGDRGGLPGIALGLARRPGGRRADKSSGRSSFALRNRRTIALLHV